MPNKRESHEEPATRHAGLTFSKLLKVLDPAKNAPETGNDNHGTGLGEGPAIGEGYTSGVIAVLLGGIGLGEGFGGITGVNTDMGPVITA